ncbi:MAG: hypothetical protein JST11_14040 [Acidobacteria bacterium]|nr:hypothetical protein [Acidobacteriota bacterium]
MALLGAAAYGFYGRNQEHRRSQQLEASNQTLTATLRQTQNEMQTVSNRLDALAAQTAAANTREAEVKRRPEPRSIPVHAVVRRPEPARITPPPEDPRWREMQAKLADQDKAIAGTRQDVSRTRDDLQGELNATRDNLEGKLDSTRDDLGGSIARSHDEIVALQKRGERNYIEFTLDKSKQLTRVGPLNLSLRKTNVKHRYYDLVMVVDDQQLEKKHVNLFEPVMLTLDDRPQPVELVVNEIDGNHVKGYVSEPKYRKSELAASTASAPAPAPQRPVTTTPTTSVTTAATAPPTDGKSLQRR